MKTKDILHNKYNIEANQRSINDNKTAISELKANHVSYEVFKHAVERFDRIVHRLIRVLCLVIALLVICNVVWLYVWGRMDFTNHETNITQEGGTNQIGGE